MSKYPKNAWEALELGGEKNIGMLKYRLNDGKLEVCMLNFETGEYAWQYSNLSKSFIASLPYYMYDVT